jgi:FMN phosphatase YigB (HAD superfamily)
MVLDAGGVLMGTDETRFLSVLAESGPYTVPELRNAVLSKDGPLDRYELGQMSTAEFLRLVREEYGPDAQTADIEKAFVSVIVPWEETRGILRTLSANHRLGVISDTSPLHFARGVLPATEPYVDVYTLSYEAGTKKPDPAMFRRFLSQAAAVSTAENLAPAAPKPADCFFVDDKRENVAAAEAVGFRGAVVNGSAELVAALKRIGLMQGGV